MVVEMRVRYRVLGPVDAVDADGRPLPLGGERPLALLAALLARPGEVVSSDRLAHLLWGDDQPDNPAAALHSQVARLRHALRAGDGRGGPAARRGAGAVARAGVRRLRRPGGRPARGDPAATG
jgi:DNA-binding SARP family transcriptional activator